MKTPELTRTYRPNQLLRAVYRRFFETIIRVSGLDPHDIAYIGDRIDNDILPALALGMQAIHVERGPWGVIQARWPEAERVRLRIETLSDLKGVLGHRG